MAHTKASGVTKGNRDSNPKNRGIKLYSGQKANAGNVIVRQLGSKFNAGTGASMGDDFTVFATASGTVSFTKKLGKTYINVLPETTN